MDFTINRKYKDSIFRKLFGSEEYKQNALDLYNAINGTRYTNLDDLEITTLEDAIYMGFKNDVSLLIYDVLSLWEHQSSFNPNMGLRGLEYLASLYSKYIEKHSLNLFGYKKVHIPTPRYFVFYNGEEEFQERTVLRLSDLYDGEGDVEVTATMLNINYEKNKKLLDSCKVLKDYAFLIHKIREYSQDMEQRTAIDAAVSYCIANDILSDFLIAHRAEVIAVSIFEWNEEKYREAMRKEAREEAEQARKLAEALVEAANARADGEKARAEEEKARAEEALRELNEYKKRFGELT